ncbi:hypothetical protein G9A89_023911 [Geosiphon pyriformis]|nr:hypothetical protein G9A89_023911 [Geosiphon pyriformis]
MVERLNLGNFKANLLLEGPKFPAFDFNSSNEILDDIKDFSNESHTIQTAGSLWDGGAGKSIPSITASILGASSVMITDAPSVVPSIERILRLNQLEKNVQVNALDWEDRDQYLKQIINPKNGPFDYILAADVVWVDYLIEPLIETINALSTRAHTCLLLAHQTRTKRSDRILFDELTNRGWNIKTVPRDELDWENGFWKEGMVIYRGLMK